MEQPVQFEVTRFADQLERSFRGGAWHGPAVAEALEGVDAELAMARSLPGHSIHEITGHLAYWLNAATERIGGAAAGVEDGRSDWPEPEPDGRGWDALLAELDAAHRRLHAAVLALDDSRLDDSVAGSDPSLRGMLFGVLQHNAYHAGQIVLLKRAAEAAR